MSSHRGLPRMLRMSSLTGVRSCAPCPLSSRWSALLTTLFWTHVPPALQSIRPESATLLKSCRVTEPSGCSTPTDV